MNTRAAVLAVASIGLLSGMDALIKALSGQGYPTFQIAFMRFFIGAILMVFVVAWRRPGWPGWASARANFMRGILSVLTASLFFYALGQMPMAEVFALTFLSPVFLALFGVVLLGETATPRTLAALAAGFAGMLVIVFAGGGFEGAGRSMTGVLAALASAVTYALAMVLLRSLAKKDPVETIVLLQNVFPALLLAGLAWWVWRPIQPDDMGFMLAMGALGTIGHLLLTRAFAMAEAAKLAPLEYTGLVWAILFGWYFFQETPQVMTMAGAGLIVAGAMIASRK